MHCHRVKISIKYRYRTTTVTIIYIQVSHHYERMTSVGTMLRRRRSCGKKQLRLKLLEHDAEDTVCEASELQHIRS
jgi:hypothetical protein